MLGHRTKEEWAVDFLEHKGYYPKDFPDDRELDDYMENNIASKLRFFSIDYRQEVSRMRARVDEVQRSISSNEESAFKIVAELMEQYEASTKKGKDLNDSLRFE